MKVDRQLIGVSWGGPEEDWYYISLWNWLTPDTRHLGLQRIWYDGPHASFGLWWFNITWSTPWTNPPKEYRRPAPPH